MNTNLPNTGSAMRNAVVVALILVAALSTHLPSRRPLPTWGGKTVAEWFDQEVLVESFAVDQNVTTPSAETVLLNLAGEAIPYLMDKAQRKGPQLAQLYDDTRVGLPDSISAQLPASNCRMVALERSVALNLLAQILGNGTNSTGGKRDLSPAQASELIRYLADVRKTNELASAQS